MTSKQPPLEAKIELDSVLYALTQGCRNVKLDKIERSLPDQLFFLPLGQTLLVEFKRPGEKVRPQQAERFRMLRALGHPVTICYSVAEFKRLLDDAMSLL